MGADESKSSGSSGCPSFASCGCTDFPNMCRRESDVTPWTLLHQCLLDKWKDQGHAEAAGFPETVLTCDGVIHKDCSFSFCMSRQGIININKGSSFFSFRKRSKFAKMAEHFEYNHIPAQMSSINHFRVKSVLCFHGSMVVLHLAQNSTSQFGLLDLSGNKFKGVFGRQRAEFINEVLAGMISPDKTKCLIRLPDVRSRNAAGAYTSDVFQLYDFKRKQMVAEYVLHFNSCNFYFDPRFNWKRIVVTNFEPRQTNSLSLVHIDSWDIVATNPRVNDMRRTLYPYLKDLCYTKDGTLIIASIPDTTCFCRMRKTRNYHPINCSIYVFNADNTETLHCIQYPRYTCTQHNCPVNYTPIFSYCGNRMAVVMNQPELPQYQYVQVYKLPSPLNLQNLCRVVLLQNLPSDVIIDLPLPTKLINFLHFRPEFD